MLNPFQRFPILLQIARFVAIGFINTACDFIIFNALSKQFGWSAGVPLALANAFGFGTAVIQSYFWNHKWIFAQDIGSEGFVKQTINAIGVGLLGVVSLALVAAGATKEMPGWYYFVLLAAFFVIQRGIWIHVVRVGVAQPVNETVTFLTFFVISVLGYLINTGIVVYGSLAISNSPQVQLNADQIKNVAKVVATVVSMVWNFLGYKLLVFRTKHS